MSQLVWLRGKHNAQRAHCALQCIVCCCTFTSLNNCYFLMYSCRNLCKTGRNIANSSTGDFLQIVHQDISFKLFTERFLQIDHQEIYPAGRCDRASRQRLTTLQKISTSALFEILTNFCWKSKCPHHNDVNEGDHKVIQVFTRCSSLQGLQLFKNFQTFRSQ